MADKTLSQQEVDALLQAVRSGNVPDAPANAVSAPPADQAGEVMVTSYDFRKPRLISSEHIRGIQLIHETFARGLTATVFASLKAQMDIKPIGIDSIVYNEFIMSLLSPTFISIATVAPHPGEIIVEMNLPLLLTLTDILLGGSGTGVQESRELTMIEKALAGNFIDYVLAELRAAWSGIADLKLTTRAVECDPELVRIVAPETPVFSAVFDLRINDTTGALNICYPFDVVKPLLPRVAARVSGRREKVAQSGQEKQDALRSILKVPFNVRVELGSGTILASQLGRLKPGDVVCLETQTDELASVLVEDKPCFKGMLCASRRRTAVRIVNRIAREQKAGAPEALKKK